MSLEGGFPIVEAMEQHAAVAVEGPTRDVGRIDAIPASGGPPREDER
jgi:hypothetical protein